MFVNDAFQLSDVLWTALIHRRGRNVQAALLLPDLQPS